MMAIYNFIDWVQLQIWKRPLISIVTCNMILLIPSIALAYCLVNVVSWSVFFFGAMLIGPSVYGRFLSYNEEHRKKIDADYSQSQKIDQCKRLSVSKIKMIVDFVNDRCKKLNMTVPEIFYNGNTTIVAQTIKLHTGKYGISLSKGLLKAIEEEDILDAATVRAILAHELSHVYYGSFDWARFWNIIDEINNVCARLMFFPFAGMLLAAGIGPFITVFSLTHVLFLCAGIAFSFLVFAENYFFCTKQRAQEFRADIKATEIVGNITSVVNVFEKIDKVILNLGFEILEDNYYNRKIVPGSFKSLLGTPCLEYLERILEKLKNSGQTEEERQNLKKYYHRISMRWKQPKIKKIYELRKELFESYKLLFPKEALPYPLESLELNVTKEPILPWYSEQGFNRYLNSYNQSCPSNHARKKVLLSFKQNKP